MDFKETLTAFAFLALGVAALSFGIGADIKQHEIEQVDRERVYCNMPDHSETLCQHMAEVKP